MFEFEDLKLGDKLIRNEANEGKVLFSQSLRGNWDLYAEGYKLAADMLVDQIEGTPLEDRLLCPVLFMYRHFIELKLKNLISNLKVLSTNEFAFKFNHKLYEPWSIVRSNLDCLRGGSNERQFDVLDLCIKELDQLDPDGYHFRYPHNRNFEDLTIPEALSMRNLKDTMNKIYYAFQLIEGGIDCEKEGRALAAELEVEMKANFHFE